MKRRKTTLILAGVFLLVILTVFLSDGLAYAASCEGVDTAIIGCDDNQSGVGYILKLVIDILSMGVGVLGVIGIVISGIQYMTAGDSQEKVIKAKRRLLEIVIGLVAFAVLYGLLAWLLPGGSLNPSDIEHYEVTEPSSGESGSSGSGGSSGGGSGSSGGSGGGASTAKRCNAVNKEWVGSSGSLQGYYINVPSGATSDTPIVIYLSGSREMPANHYGNVNCWLAGEGCSGGNSIIASTKYMLGSGQFISIIPLATGTSWSSIIDTVKNLADGGLGINEKLNSCGGVGNRKKYVMGMSNGAFAIWSMINRYPDLFDAAAPVSGGGSGISASNFTHTRIVGVVGTRDATNYETNMTWAVKQIKQNTNMTPRLIKYNGATHDTITASVNYSALFGCLLNNNCNVSFNSYVNGAEITATVYYGD